MSYPSPGPAEIVRAAQKDTDFIQKLNQDLQNLFQGILGQRNWLKWRVELETLPPLIYFSLTNLSGFQTLGEEYTGILQTDSTRRRIPSKLRILSMIVLYTFGKLMFERILKNLKNTKTEADTRLKSASRNDEHASNVTNKSDSDWTGFAQVIQKNLSLLSQFHLVIFYLQGTFYHFSKRLSGIHYILVRRYYANQSPEAKQNLKYLAWMSVINISLTLLHQSVSYISSSRNKELVPDRVLNEEHVESDPEDSGHIESKYPSSKLRKCSLCLEIRRNPSVTPCGHLFDWHCILDWLRTKQECPICREKILPSRVVPLQNYL